MDEIAESDPSDDDDEAPKISSAVASRKVTRAMYQKLSSWLAAHYQIILLPSFQTSEIVRRCTLEVATGATPAEDFITVQEMKIRSSTARAMLAYDRDVNADRKTFHKNRGLLM
ncbi:hypothetical protein V7S43_015661 [Phytophthora oleae]|uniref:HAT C-terminal dimerisation domain-containing protein n=1 Tax=Phytophthora oleae TaxID=2107226 RepID=A0ABD3EZW4_9STRA